MSDLLGGLYPMASGTIFSAPQTWTTSTNDLTTAVEATGYFSDKSEVMKANDFVNITTGVAGVPELVRGKIVDTGTAEVPILTLDTSHNSPTTIDLTNNQILVGNASNVATDVIMSGDATIINTGVLTLNAGLKRQIVSTIASFETGQQGIYKVFFNSNVTINKVRAFVTKALSATDVGTIQARNSGSANMGTGLITLALSSPFATEGVASPTTNNVIAKDAHMELDCLKTTVGGEVQIHIEYTAEQD